MINYIRGSQCAHLQNRVIIMPAVPTPRPMMKSQCRNTLKITNENMGVISVTTYLK